MMLAQPTEEQIQRALVGHLHARGKPGLYWFAVPNGGQRNEIVAAKLKASGARAGVPDLVLLYKGRFHGLELKRLKGGRLSSEQVKHRDEILKADGLWAVAHGLDAALDVLKAWGLI